MKRLFCSLDRDRRALGLGVSFYRGENFLTVTFELPLVLFSISYAR